MKIGSEIRIIRSSVHLFDPRGLSVVSGDGESNGRKLWGLVGYYADTGPSQWTASAVQGYNRDGLGAQDSWLLVRPLNASATSKPLKTNPKVNAANMFKLVEIPMTKGEKRMSFETKLREMGYELKTIDLDAGRLMHAVRSGNLIYTSGQTSTWGEQKIIGKLGDDVSVEQGYEAAKLSALNCLQAVHSLTGSIDNVIRVVKVLGMVNVAPGFNDTPSVIHGASDLFMEVFGDAGKHARSAVGMQIPFDFAVEVEAIFEVR